MTPSSDLGRGLRILADFAEIRGDSEEATDLRRAVEAIDRMPPAAVAELENRARRNRPEGERAFSPIVHAHLHQLASLGPAAATSAARAGLPALLRRLLELRAIASDEAAWLVRQAVLTLADLHAALDDERIRKSAGDALDAKLRPATEAIELEGRAIPLGRAWDAADAFVADVVRTCPGVDLVAAGGDIRRYEPLVSSVVVVGRASDPPGAIEALSRTNTVLHRSGRRVILLTREGEIDVRIAAPDEYGTVLFTATGSRAHLQAMRQRRSGPRLAAREEDVYSQSGLPFIPAELRHGSGEIEAASAGMLPALVRREDICGDLHMHTTYSDGADTLDAMVAACCALGYEYIAITDHSERAAASRTLTRADLARQQGRDCRDSRALSADRDPARRRGGHHAGRPARFLR